MNQQRNITLLLKLKSVINFSEDQQKRFEAINNVGYSLALSRFTLHPPILDGGKNKPSAAEDEKEVREEKEDFALF